MKLCVRRLLLLLVSVGALFSTALRPAHADTYQVLSAGFYSGDYQSYPIGLTADGTLVEVFTGRPPFTNPACSGSQFCYETISASGVVSAAVPCQQATCGAGFTFDNGTPCTVIANSSLNMGSVSAGPGVCNNGHEVPRNVNVPIPFGSSPAPVTLSKDANGVLIFGVSPPPFRYDLTGISSYAPLFVDSAGDFAFDGPDSGSFAPNYFFIDQTTRTSPTPEPSSLVLLGTGLAAAAGLLRKHLHPGT